MLIHQISVRGTNCYLLQSTSGTILVDPGPVNGVATVITSAIEVSVQPSDVRLILVTHGHLDHYGAAAEIKAWCGAPIVAHPLATEFSQERRNALPPAQTLRGSIARWFYLFLSPLARFVPLKADFVLDDGADLTAYGVDAQAVFLPGHSPDSLGVFTAEKHLVVGDLFVNYSVPSQPIYLWNRDAWQRSYERVRALEPHTVYVGHGDPFPGTGLRTIHPARYQLRWWVR